MTSHGFADHFSGHADAYARYRPRYPDRLFRELARRCEQTHLAWDCGTGNGQAAVGLARHFDRVVATDASADQIEHAEAHERIAYHVARAAEAPLDDGSADLVTAAQALHWFDADAFYAEARRVLHPGGLVAAWSYSLFYAPSHDPQSDAIDRVIQRYYRQVVGPYWPDERRHIEAAYETLPFPFDEIDAPEVAIEMDWTLSDVIGYLRTWSATKRYEQETGEAPIAEIAPALRHAWGEPSIRRTMTWPVPMRLGRLT